MCTFSLVLNLKYIYMLSLDTAKLLFISSHMTADREFKKLSVDLEWKKLKVNTTIKNKIYKM